MSFIRSGVVLAIIAHGLIGISLVWDKVLLKQPETRSLVSYVFWLGALSVFGLLLIPFGFHRLTASTAWLAIGAGALQLVAIYFYYAALKAGEASQTLAIVGGFSPGATALIGLGLLKTPLGGHSLQGFLLLVLGGFVMFLSEKVNLGKVLPGVLAASGCFGLVNVLEKVVFDRSDFVTGYVFFTIGTFAGALFLLVRRGWRQQIFTQTGGSTPRSRFWYFVNRFLSGVGSFLIYYAISRGNPAVVDAISGERYAIVFLGAWLLTGLKPVWLQENFSRRVLVGKTVATLLVAAGLVILGLEGETAGAGPA